MSEENSRKEVIRYWWDKAKESLTSAKREYEAESYSFAMNRLYYAAFYAVSAALMEKELSFKKHSGVRATFHKEFIKIGLLKIKWGKFYDQLYEDRQEGDYIALVSFDQEYVHEQLNRCAQFLKAIYPFILTLSRNNQ